MIETSLYTHLFQRDKNFYLYNSESGLFAKITPNLYEIIYNRDYSAVDKETLDYLLREKIVVNSENKYSYYNEQKIRFFSSSYDKEKMGLVIVPTTRCNFSCSYCFEERKTNKTITPQVEDDLISFIQSHKSLKTIELTWYGGEPLLAFPKIVHLYNRIKNEIDAKIEKHSMVTNGFLLNNKVIDFIKNSHMDHIQITLDGSKEHHNALRFIKNKKVDTFQAILNNIIKTAKALPDRSLHVRININKSNEDDYFEMYDLIINKIKLPNVFVYPGFIREETPDGCSFCYKSIDSNYAGHFYSKLMEHGMDLLYFPSILTKGCMINKFNSYIIGPTGEIYKCWNDVSNCSKIIGYINKDTLENSSLLGRYMNDVSPFSDNQCKNCKVFPICSGQCAWYKYKNVFENGAFNTCSRYKDIHFLESVLLLSQKHKIG